VLLPLLVVQPLLVVELLLEALLPVRLDLVALSQLLARMLPQLSRLILLRKLLDSGGTPTSTAGLTMAKTGGMSDANIFQMSAFDSGFAPLGFKQNATNAQAETAISPLRALDSALTSITKEAGFSVNLRGHTFSGLGVEGSGSGTILGSFVEEGKMKGESIENQMNRYATEWIKAVGARNNITSADISSIIGDGTAPGIVARAQAVLDAQAASAATVNANNMGPMADSAIASNMGPQQQTIGETGLTEEELRNLSDTQVGNLIADGKFSVFQAANFYQDRYPGLTVNDVKASMAAMGLTIPSHRDGLNMVPYDGYVAELHAGERVQTADQARASDNVAEEMSGLRQSIEDVMIAVARNTQKLYRLNDRWDKNGLPPVRA
jgi:hypothetical protein